MFFVNFLSSVSRGFAAARYAAARPCPGSLTGIERERGENLRVDMGKHSSVGVAEEKARRRARGSRGSSSRAGDLGRAIVLQ